jgi:Protein of unknown function (DUF2934)
MPDITLEEVLKITDLKTSRFARENSQQHQNQPGHIPTDLEGQIRLRAYELFQARGEVPGYEVEDWLKAEGEIRSSQEIQKAA